MTEESKKHDPFEFVSSTNINWQLLMVDLRERVPFLLRIDHWEIDDNKLRNLITDKVFYSKTRQEFLENLVRIGKKAEKTIEKDEKKRKGKR